MVVNRDARSGSEFGSELIDLLPEISQSINSLRDNAEAEPDPGAFGLTTHSPYTQQLSTTAFQAAGVKPKPIAMPSAMKVG
jgi:hypothetical protein